MFACVCLYVFSNFALLIRQRSTRHSLWNFSLKGIFDMPYVHLAFPRLSPFFDCLDVRSITQGQNVEFGGRKGVCVWGGVLIPPDFITSHFTSTLNSTSYFFLSNISFHRTSEDSHGVSAVIISWAACIRAERCILELLHPLQTQCYLVLHHTQREYSCSLLT